MEKMFLNKKDNTKEEVEIVMTFRIDKFNSEYVIYKSNDYYYAARYYEEGGVTNLITDLSNIEKNALVDVFENLKKAGSIKC